jgi:hypothetical protein
MSEQRFIVRENTGYRISPSGERAYHPATEVMVIDRAYSHQVVWSSETSPVLYERQKYGVGSRGQRVRKGFKRKLTSCRNWSLGRRRTYAADLRDRLNAEHEAWLTK